MNHPHRRCVVGALLTLLLFAATASAQTPALNSIDRYVRSELARQRIPGMSVAVLRGDSLLLARGYGYASVEHHVPATDSTVYEVGSISKQFTAAGVVLLSEQGRLRLDDPIVKFLPEGSAVWPRVTIRHLLTHTSGIPQDTMPDYRRDYTETELVRSAAAQPLDFEPGDRWSYSSTGYALLGIIIQRVTGELYGDFLREHVFRPLDMRAARVNSDADIVPNRAAGYDFVNDTLKNREWVSPSNSATADLGLSFSVRDLAQWAIGLNHGNVLSRASLDASWAPARLNDGGMYPYGLGWYLTEQRGHRRVGHSGAWQGFRANIQLYPEFGITVVVLANLAQASAEAIGYGIAGLMEPALVPPHLFAAPLPGAVPTRSIDQLLQDIAAGRDSSHVTPDLRTSLPVARREQIGGWLKAVHAWTFLGCDDVRKRGISRFGTRIERICYAKGAGSRASLLATALYAANWRAGGLDPFYGFYE